MWWKRLFRTVEIRERAERSSGTGKNVFLMQVLSGTPEFAGQKTAFAAAPAGMFWSKRARPGRETRRRCDGALCARTTKVSKILGSASGGAYYCWQAATTKHSFLVQPRILPLHPSSTPSTRFRHANRDSFRRGIFLQPQYHAQVPPSDFSRPCRRSPTSFFKTLKISAPTRMLPPMTPPMVMRRPPPTGSLGT